MKLFVIILFLFTLPSVLLPFANWILGWMSEWTQVVFVMAAFPLLMNVLQVSVDGRVLVRWRRFLEADCASDSRPTVLSH